MPLRLRAASVRLGVLCWLIAVAGCSAEAVRRAAPAAEERFAREYLRVLVDSGVESVLPRTLTETRAMPDLPDHLRALRSVLRQSPPDSLVLQRWKVEVRPGRPRATGIVYAIRGLEGPFLVGLWIEPEAGHLTASTVFYGPPPAEGRLRGDF